jgi:type II secretory pathway pseudopilin PulG
MIDKTARKTGYSLLEILLGMVLLGLVFAGAFNLLRFFTNKKVVGLTQKLTLQMEARRALVNLYKEVQEGIEILKPDAGATLPFVVFRDYVNNVHFIFLKKDEDASKLQKRDIFRLYRVVRHLDKDTTSAPHEILKSIEKCNFTAYGYSSLVITATLRDEENTFSFANMVRLKNTLSEDGE